MTSGPYEGSPALTPEQQEVVDQPADAKLLVTAGAGAGKTHTLVRRVETLVADEGLATGDVLILTFSNAAVRELRERLSANEGRSRHVRVTTFDAWALEILCEVSADIDWRTRSFDERIRAATDVVEHEETAPGWLDEVRHVVIDEVQDLVGDRRAMIEVLLEAYDCGFTVVGDPAQAIYGFQVENEEERALEPNRFFDWLRHYFDSELTEISLTRNFRARGDEARTALAFENDVRSCAGTEEAERVYENLRLALAGRMDFGDISIPFIRESLCDSSITTAVLSRTNGEALLISEFFRSQGVDHQLRRAAQDKVAPAWIDEMVTAAGHGALVLTRAAFDEIHPRIALSAGGGDGERLWRLLRSCAGDRSGQTIDLSRLREVLVARRLPDALAAQPPHPLVVSTFHRAKGLEFDRVLVADPGQIDVDTTASAADLADRARALYVAMTRPRDELFRLGLPEYFRPYDGHGFRLVRKDKRSGRWARFGYQHWKRQGIELASGDIHAQQPAGTHQIVEDALAVQQYLRKVLTAGAEVEFVRIDAVPESHEGRAGPGYVLMHEGHALGVASEEFRKDLYRYMQQSRTFQPRNWPRRISGLRVDTLETVVGERAAGREAGLGDLGFWLAPRPTGLGCFHYDPTDKD